MLAIPGSSCWPILMDLAEKDHFHGVVLVTLTPEVVRPPNPKSWRTNRQLQSLNHYYTIYTNGAWYNSVLNQKIKNAFQKYLVVASGKRPHALIRSIIFKGKLPQKSYYRMLSSRFGEMDARSVSEKWNNPPDKDWLNQYKVTPKGFSGVWQERVQKLGNAAEKIESRGGKVVFIRMPSSGWRWELLDKNKFPREDYWDKLEEAGLTTIHFKDYPELSKYECPDTSHLNYDDAEEFTASLMEILKEKGIFERK
jgi:hypothetical protein